MSLRTFVIAMAGATVLAWIGWGSVVTGIDPIEAGLPGVALFYLTLSVALIGTVTLALSFIRLKLLKKRDLPSREIHTAFRHAVLFALVAIGTLAFSAQGLLQTWHLVALVIVVVLIEQLIVQMQRK